MAVLLGLLTALDFGTADFLGGYAARRSDAATSVAGAQVASLVAGLLLLAGFWTSFPSGHDVVISLLAGIANMAALGMLFRGLAMGRMSVVAPISAATGAVVPVGWGLAFGERPSGLALVGVVLAVVAVVLIARAPEAEPTRAGSRSLELGLSLGAGLGFATSFLLFSDTASTSGYWPATLSRVAGVAVAMMALVALRRRVIPEAGSRSAVVGSGVFDAAGMGLLLLATRAGLRSIVAPVASLYPASTVVLARLVLAEKVARHQLGGLALAAVAVVLIAAG